jgi:hypothetical protein
MANREGTLKIKKLSHNVTLHVEISNEYKIRKFISLSLIKLAAYIMNVGIEEK